MKSVIYNYSSLMQRDKKIYAIAGTGIPGGLSITFAKVVVPVALVFIIVGSILASVFHINMWNFIGPNWNITWLLVWTLSGVIIGLALWNIQFSGYRLYEYLIAYLKPKKVYSNSIKHRFVTLTNLNVKAVIKQWL